MTIIVTGAGGMLGQAVGRAALAANVPDVYTFRHDSLDVTSVDSINEAIDSLPRPHIIINCAGIVRGRVGITNDEMQEVNAIGPRCLVEVADRLVQVSTDCVFSGAPAEAPYSETSRARSTDWYGKTKWQGEYFDPPHVTVRGSFIGFESGLLAWFMSQPHKATISGYQDHVWTGGYVNDYALALLSIAQDYGLTGIVHLVGEPITKAQLLQHLRFWLRPDIHVEEVLAPKGPRHMMLKSTNSRVPWLPPWKPDLLQRMGLDALRYGYDEEMTTYGRPR